MYFKICHITIARLFVQGGGDRTAYEGRASLVDFTICHYKLIHTIAPGYGDALKEDQEQETHSTGRVVVKQFEHVDPTLVTLQHCVISLATKFLLYCAQCSIIILL